MHLKVIKSGKNHFNWNPNKHLEVNRSSLSRIGTFIFRDFDFSSIYKMEEAFLSIISNWCLLWCQHFITPETFLTPHIFLLFSNRSKHVMFCCVCVCFVIFQFPYSNLGSNSSEQIVSKGSVGHNSIYGVQPDQGIGVGINNKNNPHLVLSAIRPEWM